MQVQQSAASRNNGRRSHGEIERHVRIRQWHK
jgi:hypothetical protein